MKVWPDQFPKILNLQCIPRSGALVCLFSNNAYASQRKWSFHPRQCTKWMKKQNTPVYWQTGHAPSKMYVMCLQKFCLAPSFLWWYCRRTMSAANTWLPHNLLGLDSPLHVWQKMGCRDNRYATQLYLCRRQWWYLMIFLISIWWSSCLLVDALPLYQFIILVIFINALLIALASRGCLIVDVIFFICAFAIVNFSQFTHIWAGWCFLRLSQFLAQRISLQQGICQQTITL